MSKLELVAIEKVDHNRSLLKGRLDGQPCSLTFYPQFGVVNSDTPAGIEIVNAAEDIIPPKVHILVGEDYVNAETYDQAKWPMLGDAVTSEPYRAGAQVELTIRSTGGVWFITHGWHRGFQLTVDIPYHLETPAEQRKYVAELIETVKFVPAYNLTGNEADLEQAKVDVTEFLEVYRRSRNLHEVVWVGKVLWIEFRITTV